MNRNENNIQIITKYLNELEQLRGKALDARHRLIDTYNYDIVHDL